MQPLLILSAFLRTRENAGVTQLFHRLQPLPYCANSCGRTTTTQRQKRSVLLHWLPLALLMPQVCVLCRVWFAHRRLQQFAKAEVVWYGCPSSEECGGMFTLASTWAFGFEWAMHCCKLEAVAAYFDLSSFGPEAELVQRVYNHADSLRMFPGLPTDIASVREEPVAEDPEDKDKDIVCVHCTSGNASESNDILIREGAHSAIVGWHQHNCFTPPLHEVFAGCWLCPKCVCARSASSSRFADPHYAPSRAATEASTASHATSDSNSDSSSNGDSSSSSNSTTNSDSDS